jgi:prepilin signal peptidase PulO-like enzyme (type II secretory pathway)
MPRVHYLIWFAVCLAPWLLLGALVDMWLFNGPNPWSVASWGVMVFWPFVLIWYALLWAVLIIVVGWVTLYLAEKVARWVGRWYGPRRIRRRARRIFETERAKREGSYPWRKES